jgi:acyl carrier protein
VLTLIAELDERFNLTLSDADIEHLWSVGDVLDLLRSHSRLV